MCNGHLSSAKILIDWGVSCDPTLQLSWESGERAHQLQPSALNVLHEVTLHSDLNVLNHLLSSKTRLDTMINSVAFDGNTPLHYFAASGCRGSEAFFDRLLSLDPDLDVPNNILCSPIDCFVRVGNIGAALRLIQLGSRPNQVLESIETACKDNLPRFALSGKFNNHLARQRYDLVLWLIHYALETGHLALDAGEDYQISHAWFRIFKLAIASPPLLRKLLSAGFRPDSLTGEFSLLFTMVFMLTIHEPPRVVVRTLLESMRLLVRFGERWDRLGPMHESPLDWLVQQCSIMDPEVRGKIFDSLLGCRPPEDTGAEQAHLNQMAQHALEDERIETYWLLVKYGATEVSVHPATEYQDPEELQWFRPDDSGSAWGANG